MRKATLDLWVGLFVAVGIVSLGFLALKVGNLSAASSGDTYRLLARFDNIGGLKIKAPVRSAGVLVGRVSNIQLDQQDYRAVVTMDVDTHYKFSRDTIATINTAGLLGEQYVGFDVGGDSEMLKSGDTIKQTQGAIVLEKLISQFMFSKAAETPAPAADKATDKK